VIWKSIRTSGGLVEYGRGIWSHWQADTPPLVKCTVMPVAVRSTRTHEACPTMRCSRAHTHQWLPSGRECVSTSALPICAAHGPCACIRAPCGSSIPAWPCVPSSLPPTHRPLDLFWSFHPFHRVTRRRAAQWCRLQAGTMTRCLGPGSWLRGLVKPRLRHDGSLVRGWV
jgi:hypothetical protein